MKRYQILIIPGILAICVIAAVSMLLGSGEKNLASIQTEGAGWEVKQKETASRMMEVPIILYHDIDGKGAFSVDSATLRKHFEFFRDNNIKVVPLSDFLSRMDNPKPYDGRVLVITFDDGYKSMYTKLMPLVDEFHYPITLFVYTDNVREKAEKAITWDELRELQAHGIDIQSHTLSHPDLLKLSAEGTASSRSQIFREIYFSRRIIEARMGKPVGYLAFPFGRYDLDIVRCAMDAGYTRVFSTDYGSNVVTRNNYSIRRHHIKRNYTINDLAEIIK